MMNLAELELVESTKTKTDRAIDAMFELIVNRTLNGIKDNNNNNNTSISCIIFIEFVTKPKKITLSFKFGPFCTQGPYSIGVMFRPSVSPHLYLGNPLISFSIILQEGSLGEYMIR